MPNDLAPNTAAELLGPPCPMARLAGFILTVSATVEQMDDDTADEAFKETLGPLYHDLYSRTPETKSLAGAVDALRVMVLIDDMEDGDLRIIRSVLAFIETMTPTETGPPFALLDDQAA